MTDLGSTNGTKLDGADLVGPTRWPRSGGRLRALSPGAGRRGERPAASVAADPLRRTSIDIDAAVADPMPHTPFLRAGRVDDRVLRHRAVEPPHGGAGRRRLAPAAGSAQQRRPPPARAPWRPRGQGAGRRVHAGVPQCPVRRAGRHRRPAHLDAHGRSQLVDLLRVRIGMHTGEAIMEDGDLFGHLLSWPPASPAKPGAGRSSCRRWCGRSSSPGATWRSARPARSS